MDLKKTIRKLHFWLGLASGLIVFIVAITGCLYVFEEEITNYTQYDFDYVKAQNSSRVALVDVIDSFGKNHPESKLLFIKQKESVPNATIVLGNKKIQVAYNPYDGKEVMSLVTKDSFFAIILEIHRTLLLGEIGENIVGISTFVFLFMLISGLILWFPTNFKKLKSYFTISDKSAKRLNFDLHRIGGFYASFILVFIVSTGLFFSYDFVKKATYSVTNSEPYTKWGPNSGVPKSTETDIAEIYTQIQKEYPNCIESNIYYPKERDGTIRVKLKYAYEYIPKYNTFFVNQFSGKIVQTDLNKNASTAESVKNSIFGIHTGSIFGILGKIIVFLAVLMAVSLPITGFIMWRRKKKKKSKSTQ
ncbi:PepSY-associated TM helix domain-containing protein [Flavobacterium sp. ZT3R25]|uniref:PepSY-associated TM helix domain-containing protein n=1 Tax=Flavobacterium galactosi TaxID=3398735 RepID=UPI003A8ACFEB